MTWIVSGALGRTGFSVIGAAVLAWVGMAIAPRTTHAQSPDPQPRVAYAMHSARINQIRATPDLTRLVTVGQDKTLRVWRLDDLRLLRTIHVPSEMGDEGELRAVAPTGDGREAWVGGRTGWAWHGAGQLYRVDLASGRMRQVLRALPGYVESLAMSLDGRRLAVGLGGVPGGRGELRILDAADGRELHRDSEFRGNVNFIDFARDGTLAATSADGCLRLYTPEHRLVFRAEYPVPPADPQRTACSGGPMGGVRFSPDGKRLAFGLQDRVELVVMDVASQRIERVLKVDDPAQRSLCCPNWSLTGPHLFMHGGHAGPGPTPLYRVHLDSGAVEAQPVGRQRFTNVLPLPGGELLLSTVAPSLTKRAADGRVLAEALPPNVDMRFAWEGLRLSADGRRLVLPVTEAGSIGSAAAAKAMRFDLDASPDAAYRIADAADLAATAPPARPASAQVQTRMEDFGYRQPTRIAEKTLALKPFQSVQAWAAAPDGRTLAFGTQWSVLLAEADGRIRWERELPAPAHQVAVTRDGRWVVAAVGDGTLRWYDLEGRERMGLFLHNGGSEWVAWRPDGYYASSHGGDQFMGWLVNRGDAQTPDFHRAVQFERRLYRPDLLARALEERGSAAVEAPALAAVLRELAPPRVTVESLAASADGATLELQVAVEANGRPVREVGIYVDGLPVLTHAERALGPGEAATGVFTRRLRLPRPAGAMAAEVRVEAETDESIGSDETAPVTRTPPPPARKGRLWMVAVGVHRFPQLEAMVPLPLAPNDARELAAAMRRQQGRAFSQVNTIVLSDQQPNLPTKANIVSALSQLREVGPDDTTIVFLASHGKTDAAEYYFATRDARLDDLGRIFEAVDRRTRLAPGAAPSMLSGSELTALLRRVPGRRIVFIDTCESSAADGRANPHTLLKRSASAQIAVVSAATGTESSWDSQEAPHGVFTHAILQSLGEAKAPLTLGALFSDFVPRVDAAMARMRERTPDPEKRKVLVQTPMLSALPTLQRTELSRP